MYVYVNIKGERVQIQEGLHPSMLSLPLSKCVLNRHFPTLYIYIVSTFMYNKHVCCDMHTGPVTLKVLKQKWDTGHNTHTHTHTLSHSTAELISH